MSSHSSRASSQFVFVLFVALTLALGVILTTGKASLSFLPRAAFTDYSVAGRKCTVGSDTICSVSNIYSCVNGIWKLEQNCKASGYATCVGAGTDAHCIYSDGSSCKGTGSMCLNNTMYKCRDGDYVLNDCKYGCLNGHSECLESRQGCVGDWIVDCKGTTCNILIDCKHNGPNWRCVVGYNQLPACREQ